MHNKIKRATPAKDDAAPAATATQLTLIPATEDPVAKSPRRSKNSGRAGRKAGAALTSTVSVSLDRIDIHRLNVRGREPLDERHVSSLQTSIDTVGQATPLRGFLDPDSGRIAIYDGRHRAEAMRRLAGEGRDIQAIVAIDTRPESVVFIDLYHEDVMTKASGSGERARYLLARCQEDHAGCQAAMAVALGISEATLSKRLAPAKLDPAILECMDSVRQIPLNPACAVVARQQDHLEVMIEAARKLTTTGKQPPTAVLNACKSAADGKDGALPVMEDILLDGAMIGTASVSDTGLKLVLSPNLHASQDVVDAIAAVLWQVLPPLTHTQA